MSISVEIITYAVHGLLDCMSGRMRFEVGRLYTIGWAHQAIFFIFFLIFEMKWNAFSFPCATCEELSLQDACRCVAVIVLKVGIMYGNWTVYQGHRRQYPRPAKMQLSFRHYWFSLMLYRLMIYTNNCTTWISATCLEKQSERY